MLPNIVLQSIAGFPYNKHVVSGTLHVVQRLLRHNFGLSLPCSAVLDCLRLSSTQAQQKQPAISRIWRCAPPGTTQGQDRH